MTDQWDTLCATNGES